MNNKSILIVGPGGSTLSTTIHKSLADIGVDHDMVLISPETGMGILELTDKLRAEGHDLSYSPLTTELLETALLKERHLLPDRLNPQPSPMYLKPVEFPLTSESPSPDGNAEHKQGGTSMDKIKLIDTGKCKLLAVMVPEGATRFYIDMAMFGNVDDFSEELLLLSENETYRFDPIILPEGNWQIVGIDTELTEEQCRELVKSRMDIYSFPMDEEYWNYTTSRYNDQISAKCAFNSLLEANQCYSVNPYGEKEPLPYNDATPEFNGLMAATRTETIRKWQESESNTGRWLILQAK